VRPASIPAGTPWGFHIFTLPQIAAMFAGSTGNLTTVPSRVKTQGSLILSTAGVASLGPFVGAVVVVVTFKMSDLPLTMSTMSTLPADRFTSVSDPDLYDISTPVALTALSYKVVNESPATELTGNVVDYLQDAIPSVIGLASPITDVANTQFYGVSIQQTMVLPAPPASVTECAPLRSVTRRAAEGSLVVQRFDFENLALTTPSETAWGFNSKAFDSTLGPAQHEYFGTGKLSYPTSAALKDVDLQVVSSKANSRHGSFYTGLNDDSNFTITIHMVVEKAPEVGSQYLQYASVPPPREDVTLRAASIASKLMPVGAPASHNSFGSFLSGVMKGVSKVFTPVREVAHLARALPGPLGRAAGMVEDAGAMLDPIVSSSGSPRMTSQHRDHRSAAPSQVRVSTPATARRRRGRKTGQKVSVTDDGRDEIIRVPHSRLREAMSRQ